MDRTWPRGIRKEDLALDDWRKDLAPSTELRKWFGHDPQRWAGFYQRYHTELREREEAIQSLLRQCAGRPLTLLYAARETEHKNAVALKAYVESRTKTE